MSKDIKKKNFKSKKEKPKKKKKIYEIWTFVFDMEKQRDKEIGRCHGRFKNKKQAEKVLEILLKARHGKKDSLFSDGVKTWRFKIIKQELNRVDQYTDYNYNKYAVYDWKTKEWRVYTTEYCDGKNRLRYGTVLDLTPDGIKKCYNQLDEDIYHKNYSKHDVLYDNKQESVSPYVPGEEEPF